MSDTNWLLAHPGEQRRYVLWYFFAGCSNRFGNKIPELFYHNRPTNRIGSLHAFNLLRTTMRGKVRVVGRLPATGMEPRQRCNYALGLSECAARNLITNLPAGEIFEQDNELVADRIKCTEVTLGRLDLNIGSNFLIKVHFAPIHVVAFRSFAVYS